MSGWNHSAAGGRFQQPRFKSTSRSSRFGSSQQKSPTDWLQHLADGAFFLTFLVVLLAFAGRTPIGQFCLLIGTCLTTGLWLLVRFCNGGQRWKWTGLEPLFLLGICFIALQLLPLPAGILQTLAPQSRFFLGNDLLASGEYTNLSPLQWNQLSYNPHQTRLTFTSILSLMLLFVMLVQRLQDREFARKFLVILGLSGAVYALFAVVQFLNTNDKFFWLIEHPQSHVSSGAKGSFVNENHFAGMLSLILGPVLAWTISRPVLPKRKPSSLPKAPPSEDLRLMLGGVALTLLLLGIVLSGSRGGLLLAAVAIAITVTVVLHKRLADNRLPMILSLAAMLALGGISVWGEKYFQQNANELISGDIEQLDRNDGRRAIWTANLLAHADFRWSGIGLGAHRDIMPAYQDRDMQNRVYSHAENSYLQVGSELGLMGWILLGGTILLVLRKVVLQLYFRPTTPADLPWIAGIAGALGVFLVHGCYDFGWYTPAYMLMLTCLIAFLFATENETAPVLPSVRPGFGPLLLLGLMLGGLLWLSPAAWRAAQAEIPEYRYLLHSHKLKDLNTPEDKMLSLRMRIQYLNDAIRCDPDNGRYHLWMSNCLRGVLELNMLHGQLPMPLTQVRAAAYGGGFTDPVAFVQWLKMPGVMGESYSLVKTCLRETRLAVQRCPFLTNAWLIQSDYCFVESPDPTWPQYFLEMARRTEPHASEIQFTAGYHAWNNGDAPTAFAHWKKIFSANQRMREHIISLATATVGPEEMIELFEPNQSEMIQIAQAYNSAENPHRELAMVRLAELTLKAGPEQNRAQRERNFLTVFNLLAVSQQSELTLQFIEQATLQESSSPPLRKAFGTWLAHKKQYDMALGHLETYMQQMSHDPEVLKLIHHCRKQQNPIPVRQATFSRSRNFSR